MQLPETIEEITPDFLSAFLAERYPGTVVTEANILRIIHGSATKVHLALSYNDAGEAHDLPATMWLKGGFEGREISIGAYVREVEFYNRFGERFDPEVGIPRSYMAAYSRVHAACA